MEAARLGFPGARVTGVCLIVGPCLAVVATVIGSDAYAARGTEFVELILAHRANFDWGIQISLGALMLMILAVVGLATMIAATRPGWARAAGVVTILGLCGPISFQAIYWAASMIVDTSAHRAAAAQLLDRSQMIPRSIMNVSGPCLVVGFILLGIAAYRSGVLDRPRAVLLGVTCVMPAGFISGHLVISAAAFACAALALVPLGVTLLRTPAAGVASPG